jgi:hypothetical protein
MLKKLIILLLIFAFFSFPEAALALKVRTKRGGSSSSGGNSYLLSNRVGYSVRFNPNRTGLIISFSALTNANSVNYSLSYNTNGIAQGAMGTITNPQVSIDTREVLFGTCSGGVCRYHINITNAKLIITSKLKSGYTTRKTYRIRI